MRKKYHTKMELKEQEHEQFDPDKSIYENFVKSTLLNNILHQAKNEIKIEETYNSHTDTIECKLELVLMDFEEYDKLKRIEREYKRFNTRQTNANDSRCKL